MHEKAHPNCHLRLQEQLQTEHKTKSELNAPKAPEFGKAGQKDGGDSETASLEPKE